MQLNINALHAVGSAMLTIELMRQMFDLVYQAITDGVVAPVGLVNLECWILLVLSATFATLAIIDTYIR